MPPLDLDKDMQFEITSTFMPNLNRSQTLKILEVTQNSVVIQMDKSNGRGVFPAENFHYWIKRGSLIKLNGHHKRSS
ncbi:hypothetical protein ACOSZF_20810 [Cytobacillus firmus]|uniref:hypothetical protein n=1 Tax=Cytobacillus firmus TaxID=1399 RepID=UPI001F381ACF|nr:hypothetical protein [Cytobacillus firmus]MDD9312399.1 hypothetical protein [Cytobacillus firmus]MEC1893410.1 hypothetical protein [Cytobacillus firmus]MED1905252.1 hypothetical protein [Cytobacillus firmus]MED1939892.1 hypothetical protein [Cytobacillus firmus]MED4450846.1 hypothetical protein [Cytobacillus firmus]